MQKKLLTTVRVSHWAIFISALLLIFSTNLRESGFHFYVIALYSFYLILISGFKLPKYGLIISSVVFLVYISSLLYDERMLYAVFSSAKIALLVFSLYFLNASRISDTVVKSVLMIILLLSLITPTDNVGLFGIDRLSGVYSDPNLIGYLIASILFTASTTFLPIVIITLSQSVAVILSGIVLYLVKNFRNYGKYILFILLINAGLMYWITSGGITMDRPSTINPTWFEQRVTSLFIRFDNSQHVWDVLSNFGWWAHLVGIGSGRSHEFFNSVLHSFYFQTYLDHGIAGLVILIYSIWRAMNTIREKFFLLFSLVVGTVLDVFSTGGFFIGIYIIRSLSVNSANLSMGVRNEK